MKVYDNKRSLYYLTACEDGIIVSLIVRETEMESFLHNEGLKDIHAELKCSTRYSNGYALRFEVKSMEESKIVANFLSILIKERMSEPEPVRKGLHPKAKRVTKQA